MKNRTFATLGLLALLATTSAFGQQMQTLSLGPALTFSFNADPVAYVVTGYQQFGTIDLKTGVFHQIGPPTPEGQSNLVPGPEGRLYSLTYSGNLETIDPATGAVTVVGATGLGYNAFSLAEVEGKLFATDFNNNLYRVDRESGAAHLIRATGMPADPSVPYTINPDGTMNLCDETIYGVGGKLYASFDAFTIDPVTLTMTPKVDPELYRINPWTGVVTPVAPTALNLGASVEVRGRFYAFKLVPTGFNAFGPVVYSQVVTLDPGNGKIKFVTDVRPGRRADIRGRPGGPGSMGVPGCRTERAASAGMHASRWRSCGNARGNGAVAGIGRGWWARRS